MTRLVEKFPHPRGLCVGRRRRCHQPATHQTLTVAKSITYGRYVCAKCAATWAQIHGVEVPA